MNTILEYRHVTVCYGEKKVVDDVSLTVPEGEVFGIVGESGSGKTTLLRAAMGLLGENGYVARGDIYYFPTEDNSMAADLPDLSRDQMQILQGQELGMIFQDTGAALCPVRKIIDLIFEQCRAHNLYGRGRKEKMRCAADAAAVLAKMGISDPWRVLESYPFELSGGMNQRVGIAMALMLHPRILLADEPTSALDALTQKKVAGELLRAVRKSGMTMILVTHNIGFARYMTDSLLVLKDGKVQECGRTQDILEHPVSAYTRQLLEAQVRLDGK